MGTEIEDSNYEMYIDGKWLKAASGNTFETVNPYTGEAWARLPEAGEQDVDAAVTAARRAFDDGPWPRMTGRERARYIKRLASLISRDAARLATLEVRDNGKLITEMEAQLATIPAWYEYFAEWADKIGGEVVPTDRSNFLVYTTPEPVGVVAAITAWNSPLLLTAFKLGPALAAGCTCVVKPAEQTPVGSLAFAQLVEEAEFPPGVINVITGDGPGAGAALVRHPGVDKIGFTGSTETGIDIARSAADHLATTSLELGGKSPQVIFDDADLDAVETGVVSGVFAASGQTCVAGSRVLVADSIYEELVSRLAKRAQSLKLGDPMDRETQMGPLAFGRQQDRVLEMVSEAISEGASAVAGGGRPEDADLQKGLFIAPTVLTDVRPEMRVVKDEIFGPVCSVVRFKSEEEAVRIANSTRFGLAAGIWTKDVQRAHRVAKAVRAGTVWINAYRTMAPNVPFGGFKQSGYGRENGYEAIREYTRTKAVWVELEGAPRDPFKMG